jgi:hypothetical protein
MARIAILTVSDRAARGDYEDRGGPACEDWLRGVITTPIEILRRINREEAQAWLLVAGYRPTTLQLGPLVRLGARMTAANVAFDDHPNPKRCADRIETTTADSVLDWLAGAPQLAGALRIVR